MNKRCFCSGVVNKLAICVFYVHFKIKKNGKPLFSVLPKFKRRMRYSHRIYYFTDYQLVVVVHDASTSQVAKCFLAGRPLMPKSFLQRFKFRKNPEPKQ